MKITIDMPEVTKCTAKTCAYNVGESCHARAITIGDDSNPRCDTHFDRVSHTKAAARIAGVGACKVTACKFNDDFECGAQAIDVGYSSQAVKCLTFTAKTTGVV